MRVLDGERRIPLVSLLLSLHKTSHNEFRYAAGLEWKAPA